MNLEPFTIAVPQAALDDLHQRLSETRWPDELPGSGWTAGSNLSYMKDLVHYWQTTFDWRSQEHMLNTFAHFRTTIHATKIHFLHLHGRGSHPMPLLLTHGWPSSFVEMLKILPRLADPARYGGNPADAFDVQERAFLAKLERWEQEEGAYAHLQQTKPQTLAYGLNDSPAGLAAWIVEKFCAWSDCDGEVERRFTKEELLTNISLYWFTQTINSSFVPYYLDDGRNAFRKGEFVAVPCAVAVFPKNMSDDHHPREYAERVYNVQRWTEMSRGGHFPALEEPDLLVEDIRAFFRPLREEASQGEEAHAWIKGSTRNTPVRLFRSASRVDLEE